MRDFAKRRKQTCRLVRLLNIFAAHTPGVQAVSREILDLDGSGSLTPVDALLRIEEDAGGQSRIEEGSIVGAPELVVLVKPDTYPGGGLNREIWKHVRQSDVKEFVFWEYKYEKIQWTSFAATEVHPFYIRAPVGITFPTLGIDVRDLNKGRVPQLEQRVRKHIRTPFHKEFISKGLGKKVPAKLK